MSKYTQLESLLVRHGVNYYDMRWEILKWFRRWNKHTKKVVIKVPDYCDLCKYRQRGLK